MKFSTRSQYGLRAMVYLSLNPNKPFSLKQISEVEGIPFDYLEKILSRLRKAGLIKSAKGVSGGYFLSRRPKNIRIGEIINTLEGKIALVKCVGSAKSFCPWQKNCRTRNVWEKAQRAVVSALNSFTLFDLISNKK
ncbi:MAG: Rrf2 family transcriptional regulator [Candidatus Nealsonbacteria bacterium CG08_land_8_20_14_0_20_43_11]|uniref:Rrf2 family transcriptional regulator n=1 Tax=Candidatus Nealsonbacteria bacterium CG08_land_8_20_14_0_20_43_11 TaxID=1974706 RepID=A0A2M6T0N6_9BACT|nr:MAG: Rrf2 family transcriptional regulator [Candidatus Nealsonbacteria bacterium CG08_land_8_20_14_0_20_43_11]